METRVKRMFLKLFERKECKILRAIFSFFVLIKFNIVVKNGIIYEAGLLKKTFLIIKSTIYNLFNIESTINRTIIDVKT